MKITEQKLQQLIRESIFKRIFGKKEKTKTDIPDEIASDFGGGSEDVVDDFNSEDNSDESLTPIEISRRKAIKIGAGLAAGGLALSNLDLGSSESSNDLPNEEFRVLAKSMLGEFYDLFNIDFKNHSASYKENEFEVTFRPNHPNDIKEADDLGEIQWTITVYGIANEDGIQHHYELGMRSFESYQSAEDWIMKNLISVGYDIKNGKKASVLRENAKKPLGLGRFESLFSFSSEYGGCLIFEPIAGCRHVYRYRMTRFEMESQIKQNGQYITVSQTPHRMTAQGNSEMEVQIAKEAFKHLH